MSAGLDMYKCDNGEGVMSGVLGLWCTHFPDLVNLKFAASEQHHHLSSIRKLKFAQRFFVFFE